MEPKWTLWESNPSNRTLQVSSGLLPVNAHKSEHRGLNPNLHYAKGSVIPLYHARETYCYSIVKVQTKKARVLVNPRLVKTFYFCAGLARAMASKDQAALPVWGSILTRYSRSILDDQCDFIIVLP